MCVCVWVCVCVCQVLLVYLCKGPRDLFRYFCAIQAPHIIIIIINFLLLFHATIQKLVEPTSRSNILPIPLSKLDNANYRQIQIEMVKFMYTIFTKKEGNFKHVNYGG